MNAYEVGRLRPGQGVWFERGTEFETMVNSSVSLTASPDSGGRTEVTPNSHLTIVKVCPSTMVHRCAALSKTSTRRSQYPRGRSRDQQQVVIFVKPEEEKK